MATTKAYRTKISGHHSKRNHTGVATAVLGNSFFHGIATAVPYNPRVRQLMPKATKFQASKVIVVKVNTNLDQRAELPINHKAAEAKNMFAKYRKAH